MSDIEAPTSPPDQSFSAPQVDHKDDHCSITDCDSSAQTGDTIMMRAPTSPSSFPLADSSPTSSDAGHDNKQLALGLEPKEAATKRSNRSKRMNHPTVAGVEETCSEQNQTAIDAKSQTRATTKRTKRVKNKSKRSEMEAIAPEEQQDGSSKHKAKNTHHEHKTDKHAKRKKRDRFFE